ncbi:MAG: glycerophosphodiester phosphodiesterase [Chloroflexota bacterium]
MRGLIVLVVGLTAVYLLFAVRSQPLPPHPFFAASDDVLVIAHQGGEGLRPSNTLAAFANAVDLGVDVLETDVHATADGELVLMHDDTVDRTTNGSGSLRQMTLAQVRALDAGYYWTEDDGQSYPYRGQGLTVPTLRELLMAFPDMRFNVEIKQQEPPMAEPLCNLIRELDMGEQMLVASFNEAAIVAFREACPEVATSMVQAEIIPFFALSKLWLGATYQPQVEAIQVPEFRGGIVPWGDLRVVNGRFIRDAQQHNIEFHVWTVNETGDMQRMLDWGVDGIITDRPDRLLELLGR